jgi:DNA-binding NarL/FixJ family response regulator
MSITRVVLFDDNSYVRDSLSMMIGDVEDLVLIGAFEDCNDVLTNIAETQPDVVLMDIDMPGMNGIEAVKLIHAHFPAIQILMQTVFDNDEKVFAAIKAGASGYILKNAGGQNLVDDIREVTKGGSPMSPGIARKVLNHLKADSNYASGEHYALSPREKEVLSLLVQGLSYKMISDKLSITYDTVRAHMKKIYEKLHVSSMTEAVAKAIHQKLFPHF